MLCYVIVFVGKLISTQAALGVRKFDVWPSSRYDDIVVSSQGASFVR